MRSGRITRALAVAGLTLTAGGLTGPSAQAATYVVEHCTAAKPGISGWTAGHAGAWVTVGNNCASGGQLYASFDGTAAHNAGDFAGWTFQAPSNTTIAGVSFERRHLQAGPPHPGGFGDPYAQILADSRVLDQCVQLGGCGVRDGAASYDADGASNLQFRVMCTGFNGCTASPSAAAMRGIRISLEDRHNPSLAAPSGSLRSESTTARVRELAVNATDTGGGVYRRTLIVDGTARAPVTMDANGGACATPFATRNPCKPTASETISFDTATLTDGNHSIAVRVTDATDVNKVETAPWLITVDNLPPTFTGPEIVGPVARVGSRIACAITGLSGQAPTLGYRWLRANADGSGAVAIAGATDSAYTPVAADSGRKVLCEVAATDKGGTTRRASSPTSGPFADGAVVAPAPAPPATPAPTPPPAEPSCPEVPTGRGAAPTQDYDGDGVANCRDADDDNDGTPDTRDEAPFDSALPRQDKAGIDPGMGGSGPTPLAVSSPATTPILRLGRDSVSSSRRRSSWRRSAFTLTGRLTSATNAPLAGVPIVASETIGKRTRRLATTTSAPDGSWKVRVPRGPTRTIVVRATDGANTATVTTQQTVKAQVDFRATRRTLRRGGSVLFRGRLRGGRTNTREKLVEFQVHYRGAWRSITTLRVDRKGRFKVRYRFGPRSIGRYTFRARSLPTKAYPFAVGTSSTKKSRVRIR